MRFVSAFIVLCLGVSAQVAAAAPVESITMPRSDVFMGFVVGGKVDRVLVKEGKRVRKGELLASLDDAAERLELARLAALAEDRTRLEAAEADLEQKRADLKKLEWASEHGAVTEWEIEHARLAVTTAELQVKLEQVQVEQNRLRRDELQAQIDRMRIYSSISGNVEVVDIEPGESAEGLAPVIRVVRTDPLWIDVPVPVTDARQVDLGDEASVSFPGKGPDAGSLLRKGKVIHVATVADAASDTLRLRVEVPNPDSRPAGERVMVSFDQP